MEGQGMGVGGRVYLCYPGSASVLGRSYAPELQERGFLSMSAPTPYDSQTLPYLCGWFWVARVSCRLLQ